MKEAVEGKEMIEKKAKGWQRRKGGLKKNWFSAKKEAERRNLGFNWGRMKEGLKKASFNERGVEQFY